MSSARGWIIAVAALVILVPSCSRAHAPIAPARQTDSPVLTGEPAGDNAADTRFAESVAALDRQAIDLAALVRNHSGSAGVVSLATTIETARRSEMQIVNVLLVQWNTSPEGREGPRSPVSVSGMIDPAAIARLRSARGSAFDTLWVQSMMGLDNGAVSAATSEVGGGKNIDAIDIARQISAERPAEIDQLQKIL